LDYYIIFPVKMLTVWLTNVWLHILGQVECPLLVLIVPQTLVFMSCSVSAKCDGSGLSFCLKLIELCPPTYASWLLISSYYRYNLILPHTPFCQYSVFCYCPWIAGSKFQATQAWDCGFIKWQFFGFLNFDYIWK
jgi:hypothetical protein